MKSNESQPPPKEYQAEVVNEVPKADDGEPRVLPKLADFLDAAGKVIGRVNPTHGGAMAGAAIAARALDVDVEAVRLAGRALAGAGKRAFEKIQPYAQMAAKSAHKIGHRPLVDVAAEQIERENKEREFQNRKRPK